MAVELHNNFPGIEYPLVFYKNKPVRNVAYTFYEDDNETEYSFTGQSGYTFKIFEEREGGKTLLSLMQGSGLTLSGNIITMNASSGQMNIALGKYYYEMCYLDSGGYEIVLLYGEAKLI